MKLSRSVFIVILGTLLQTGYSQSTNSAHFLFPVYPKRQAFLAGNMGELRTGHFHAGIDIKVGIGSPVLAVADGYVSRIKVSADGYGYVLYVTHPNGWTTVYAHLKSFSKKIANYVLTNQYAKEAFEIELFPYKNQFLCKRGDTIAFSGNTGYSYGPHLHFEIRDSLENFLDPLAFGFSEIKDHLSPVSQRMVIRTLDGDARVSGEFGRFDYPLSYNGKSYYLRDTIYVKGLIGFEILAYDRMDAVHHQMGVKFAELWIDGKKIYSFDLSCMSFYCNTHSFLHGDFDVFTEVGKKFQRLFLSDGNELPVYKMNDLLGKYNVSDTLVHLGKVVLKDSRNNISSTFFYIKGYQHDSLFLNSASSMNSVLFREEMNENFLKITLPNAEVYRIGKLYVSDSLYVIRPSCITKNRLTYLIDCRKIIPDSLEVGGFRKTFSIKTVLYPGRQNYYQTDSLSILFPPASLFDTLFLDVNKNRDRWSIGNRAIPLASDIFITLKVNLDKWGSIPSHKIGVYVIDKKGVLVFKGGVFQGTNLSFQTDVWGDFLVLADTIGPGVQLVKKTLYTISFKIRDDLSGIASFRAILNGKWILMCYDRKKGLLYSQEKDNKSILKGIFQLEVTDRVGNKRVYEMKL